MNEWLQAISTVGFPIAMCGVLCYYIYKVQTKLIESINANTTAITKLIENEKNKLEEKEID